MMTSTHLDPAAIAAYLDHGLEAAERERTATHFANCADCRARLTAQARAEARPAGSIAIESRRRALAWRPLLAAAGLGALLLSVGLWYGIGGRERGMAERGAEPVERVPERAPEGVAEPVPAHADVEAPALGIQEPSGELARREPAEPPAPEEELLALRGATKTVEGKTFRLVDGTWTDTAYRAADQGAPREIRRGSPEYEALVASAPRLAAWSDVGPRVLVVLDTIPYILLPSN